MKKLRRYYYRIYFWILRRFYPDKYRKLMSGEMLDADMEMYKNISRLCSSHVRIRKPEYARIHHSGSPRHVKIINLDETLEELKSIVESFPEQNWIFNRYNYMTRLEVVAEHVAQIEGNIK